MVIAKIILIMHKISLTNYHLNLQPPSSFRTHLICFRRQKLDNFTKIHQVQLSCTLGANRSKLMALLLLSLDDPNQLAPQ